jgi:3-isopropylmalate/(R)-2-methylmalate dehydratase small subunit
MEKFINLKGVVAPFNFINIDTDKIIPKQFLKTIKRTGLGKHLFDDMRFNEDGSEKQDFVLNKEPYRSSKIIVAGDNFGCGSSREHAPWALSDFGIKCIISTSFADIFYNNSFKNGLLPIKVTPEQKEALMADAKDVENPEIEIDLPSQEIRRPNGSIIKFELEPFRKKCLLEGLDDIDITLEKSEKINSFEATMELERPWL